MTGEMQSVSDDLALSVSDGFPDAGDGPPLFGGCGDGPPRFDGWVADMGHGRGVAADTHYRQRQTFAKPAPRSCHGREICQLATMPNAKLILVHWLSLCWDGS